MTKSSFIYQKIKFGEWMTNNISEIPFSKKNIIANLSEHMFGTNLEHIGDAIYRNGIWAEVIQNRKFCSKATWKGQKNNKVSVWFYSNDPKMQQWNCSFENKVS